MLSEYIVLNYIEQICIRMILRDSDFTELEINNSSNKTYHEYIDDEKYLIGGQKKWRWKRRICEKNSQ